MSYMLKAFQEKKVLVLTVDGRTLVGNLALSDNQTNIVLTETIERMIRPPEDSDPSTEVDHGLYLIRGDNVVVIGLVDEDLDNSIDWSRVRGNLIKSTKNA